MPTEIRIRCNQCHQLKLNTEFASHVIAQDNQTKKRKIVRDRYCRECVKTNPRLRQLDRDYRIPDR